MKETVFGVMLRLLLLLLIGMLTLAFSIHRVKPDIYSIGFGEVVFDSIDPAGDADSYTFSANADDTIFVRMSETSGSFYPEISLNAPNGTELTRDWSSDVAEISYTVADAGEYTVLAFDHYGSYTGNCSILISGPAGPSAPVSSFTYSPSAPYIGEIITFDASASYDSDGYIVSYRWDFGDGNITIVSSPVIMHTYTTADTYAINLTIMDNEDLTDTTTKFISTQEPENNPPYQPQLVITPSLAVEDADDLIVTVTGPTPADSDGNTVTYIYRWLVDVGTGEFLDDELADRGDHTDNKVPAADTTIGDVWRVEVTPIDEHAALGPSAMATWQPVVLDATRPLADAGPDQTVNEDTLVAFNGSNSFDNIEIVSYTWTFTDVTPRTLTDVNPTYNFTTPGTYSVTLNVTDTVGNWATDTIMITVNDVTRPAAQASINETVVENTLVSFDAGGSSDNVGVISYEWDFGDGTTGTGPTVNHTYVESGNYNVTLTVRDAAGNEDTHSTTVTVLPTEIIREPRSVQVVAQVAVVGATATLTTVAIASTRGLGQSFNSAVSKLPIPKWLREFLKLYGEKIFETVDKVKLEALHRAPFITKGELGALGISVLVMTIVFSFVEANGLPRFLDPLVLAAVIPSTLLSACVVSVAGELSEALCTRTCKVYRRFSLWLYGLAVFLISGLILMFPFSSPGKTRYQSGEISEKTKGLIVLSKTLILLTLTTPFAALFMLGFTVLGDAGLLLTLMTVCYSLVPLKPLVGKALFDYRKDVSLTALFLTGFLFYVCSLNLLPHETYLAVGIVSIVLAAITLNQLGKTHPK